MKILTIDKVNKGEMNLPKQFKEDVRPDLIKKAFLVIQNNKRQRYGATPLAGKMVSAELSRRRNKYRGSYGIGISRVPRKIMSRRGTRMNWVGAFAPGTVGGRRAHPPKAGKVWKQKINTKERRKAIRSALSANVVKQLIEKRGHKLPLNFPFIVDTKIEELDKTKQVIDALTKLGFGEDLERTSERKIRAGKGKLRGRKYIQKKGLLIVVSDKCKLLKAATNIPGIDIARVDKLNVELLAPGADYGRLTLFSEDAIKRLEAEQLYTDNIIKEVKKE